MSEFKKKIIPLINTNFISGLLFLVLGVALILIIPTQVKLSSNSSGVTSATIPYVVGFIMITGSIILIFQGIISKNNKQIPMTHEQWVVFRGYILYTACFFIYAKILPYVGFVISSILLSVVILMNYKCKKKMYYVISFVSILVLFFVFKKVFYVKLPSLIL